VVPTLAMQRWILVGGTYEPMQAKTKGRGAGVAPSSRDRGVRVEGTPARTPARARVEAGTTAAHRERGIGIAWGAAHISAALRGDALCGEGGSIGLVAHGGARWRSKVDEGKHPPRRCAAAASVARERSREREHRPLGNVVIFVVGGGEDGRVRQDASTSAQLRAPDRRRGASGPMWGCGCLWRRP
jgi:hypothetical protein